MNWPPVDWKTAPGFGYADANLSKTQAPVAQLSSALQNKMQDDSEGTAVQIDNVTPISVYLNWTIKDDSALTSATLVSLAWLQ